MQVVVCLSPLKPMTVPEKASTVSIIPVNFDRENNAHVPTPLHVVCYLQPSVAILTCQMVIPFFPIGEDPGGGTYLLYIYGISNGNVIDV